MKRVTDIFISFLSIVLLSPIIVIIAILVRFKFGRPILFIQVRPGYLGRPFKIYKFRTMTDQRNENGELLPDSVRLTRFGKTLRKSSLDELPQLINVLKGDLSLVGPRPLLMQYLDRYTPHQARRHEVRPGITGWAQVNGRNAISWEEKFELDIWYVENQSIWLDLKIIWLTLKKVIRSDGVSQKDHVTMEEFKG